MTEEDQQEERLIRFLSGDMPEEEMAFLQAELEDSPELRASLRDLEEKLLESCLNSLPKAVPPSGTWDAIRDRISVDLPTLALPHSVDSPSPPVALKRNSWAGFIWPLAATLLLSANIFLYWQLKEAKTPGRQLGTDSMAAFSQDPEATESSAATVSPSPEEPSRLLARVERLREDLETKKALLAAKDSQIARLAMEHSEVSKQKDLIEAQYERFAARFSPFFAETEGLARYTVIEMVDQTRFASDSPRRGLAEIAGQFLTGPGNIVSTEIVSPFDEASQIEGSVASVDLPPDYELATGETLTASGSLSGEMISLSSSSVAGSTAVPLSPDVPSDKGSTSNEPLAFTVWSDTEQQGFLDIYNLPEIPSGEVAQLWVRASELDPYLPVGEIPPLVDGSGSVFYSVEEGDFTPSEMLITSEPEGSVLEEPKGRIILRGP